jgi:hypothetical protein
MYRVVESVHSNIYYFNLNGTYSIDMGIRYKDVDLLLLHNEISSNGVYSLIMHTYMDFNIVYKSQFYQVVIISNQLFIKSVSSTAAKSFTHNNTLIMIDDIIKNYLK